MPEPSAWFRIVLVIGALHALGAGASLWWLLTRLSASMPPAVGAPVTSLLAAVAVFIPFLAYAADSRRLLQPDADGSDWQVIGGLVGLSVSVIALHGVACIHAATGGLMVYRLLVVPLIVGGLGAAVGIAVAHLADYVVNG